MADLLEKPWDEMSLGEQVRYLLGAGCSAEEVAYVTGLSVYEIEQRAEDLLRNTKTEVELIEQLNEALRKRWSKPGGNRHP